MEERHEHEHPHKHEHHHHDHEHHDHEHEREHHEHEAETGIEITAHESAWIGTVRCRIPGNYAAACDTLQERMEEEAMAIEMAGGMIGHIKAFAREENRSCMLSLTECGDTRRRESVCPSVYVEHAAIVFGIHKDTLREVLITRFGDFLD